jgi:Family of unknown function (DUF6492)
MLQTELRDRPLDVVTACRAADLSILRITERNLREYMPFKRLHVFTASKALPSFRRALSSETVLLDEDAVIPGITLPELRNLTLPGFPKGAGWYFQQLLKFSFAFQYTSDDYYLIWDADTVPLRPLKFFDADGRMLFTKAEENHSPYFDTYRKLLLEEPHREFSFIAQHLIVQKSILREMLAAIEANIPGPGNWAQKIMHNLSGNSTNVFSEYEMLGHYVKNHYPERASYRELPWLRTGSRSVTGVPSERDLSRLSTDYYFAAFESSQRPLRALIRRLRRLLRGA